MRLLHPAASLTILAVTLLGARFAQAEPATGVDRVQASARSSAAPNAIAAENTLAGSQAGLVPDSVTGGAIDGYASETGALPGGTLHFHVSTNPGSPYRVEIYRFGWYGGAGARLIGCAPSCSGWQAGQALQLPSPDANGLVQANWPVTASYTLPADATSGYYRARFVLPNGQATSTYVIVRAPPNDASSILVQVPVNTWQAYNGWGGRSLYSLPGGVVQANRVSFDRPYAWRAPGNQSPFGWEYPLVLFLEQSGYDVSYQTDLDTDADPSSLLSHRLIIDIGHDEYWTGKMRDAFETARDSGVNLAFMGANDAYWQVRYENGGRTIVGYKTTPDPIGDPAQQTILFRALSPSRRECELIGIQHQGGELTWSAGDFSVVPSSLGTPWFDDTGLDASSVLRGLAGVETDTIPRNQTSDSSCGQRLTVYFHREGGGDTLGNADVVSYTAASGATVFAAGSKRFVWGLGDPPSVNGRNHGLVDPRLQRFVHNMLDDLSAWRVADLGLSLATQTKKVRVGRTVKVLAVIGNNGPDLAAHASLDVTLPPGLAFVRVASTGLRCTRAPLHCTIVPLPAGSSVRAVFTLRSTLLGARTLTARALALTATDPDPVRGQAQLIISPSES